MKRAIKDLQSRVEYLEQQLKKRKVVVTSMAISIPATKIQKVFRGYLVRRSHTWRRSDLSIVIPPCDHEWVPAPRMMNEHTTYECDKCAATDGCA